MGFRVRRFRIWGVYAVVLEVKIPGFQIFYGLAVCRVERVEGLSVSAAESLRFWVEDSPLEGRVLFGDVLGFMVPGQGCECSYCQPELQKAPNLDVDSLSQNPSPPTSTDAA